MSIAAIVLCNILSFFFFRVEGGGVGCKIDLSVTTIDALVRAFCGFNIPFLPSHHFILHRR